MNAPWCYMFSWCYTHNILLLIVSVGGCSNLQSPRGIKTWLTSVPFIVHTSCSLNCQLFIKWSHVPHASSLSCTVMLGKMHWRLYPPCGIHHPIHLWVVTTEHSNLAFRWEQPDLICRNQRKLYMSKMNDWHIVESRLIKKDCDWRLYGERILWG